jgi:hypothetical protein
MALMLRYRTEPDGRGGYQVAEEQTPCLVDGGTPGRALCGRRFVDLAETYTLARFSDAAEGMPLCQECRRRWESMQAADRARLEAWLHGRESEEQGR